MKALAFNDFGGPDKLRYQDGPDPKIKPNEVLVRVRACALNHLDLFVREGIPALKTPLPFWTGCDIAGEVAEVGAALPGVEVGERVGGNATPPRPPPPPPAAAASSACGARTACACATASSASTRPAASPSSWRCAATT